MTTPETMPDDPLSSDSWEAMDKKNRLMHLRAVSQLPDEAIVRVTPSRGHMVRYNGRDYVHPRSFKCTYGEAKTAHVQVTEIIDAHPVVDAPPARAQRGKGLNRLLGDDAAGFNRAE